MCGLAGVIGTPPGGGDVHAVASMLAAVAHRGPDGEGLWREGDAAIGHRRLGMVDLSAAGAQPMVSADGRYVIACNGEIYNHRALRVLLGKPVGGDWRGHSDVEVLLEAITRWGLDEALRRSFGMFALALWDRRDAALHLARDRFGEKPLYFSASETGVAFASELTSLRRGTDCGDVDGSALAAFFRFGYVPAPLAILGRARKLSPATRLTWRRGAGVVLHEWWDFEAMVTRTRAARFADDAEAAEALDETLRAVIAEQMTADVPVGVFLSGGLDSAVTAAAMQSQSSSPVRSFTMGFDAPAFDEAPAAAAVARWLGTEHLERYVSDQDALAVVPDLGATFDEPFADASQIPMLLMARLARQSVKACLSGDGGDEMFAGYVRYDGAPRLWRALAPWPRPARRAAGWLLERTPLYLLEHGFAALRPLAGRYTSRGGLGSDARRVARWMAAKDGAELYGLTMTAWPGTSPLAARDPAVHRLAIPAPAGLDWLEAMQWRDIHGYLPGDVLTKVDRAAMRFGLETRAPLLDVRIAEIAWRMPEAMKRRRGQGKWILRQVLRRYLPEALVERRKAGFTPPMHAWLSGPLRDWAQSLIGPAAVRSAGVFNERLVARTWRRFLAGDASLDHQVWSVLMYQAWRTAPS